MEADHADIVIEKTWNVADGVELPEEITVSVTQTVGTTETTADTVVLSADNNWTATLEDMPLYNEDGTKITYSVDEDDVTAPGYYETIVTEIESSVTEQSSDRMVYTEGDNTIIFYFDSTAPHININGTAYTSSTTNWTLNSDGTYSFTITYTNPNTGRDYTSTWVYNPTEQTYTYIFDDYMEVDEILYVTYTSTAANDYVEKILYDADEYVDTTSTVTRDAKDNEVDRNYYNYVEQADTGRYDQEFWSTNRAIEDMPAGTTIRVGYGYTYGYYDKFGVWNTYSSTAEQTFDTSSSDFTNVCSNAGKKDTQRGYDVILQLSDDLVYKGDGLKEIYDVDITNTPVSSLSINKEVTNAEEMPDKNQEFTFTITLDDFLGVKISDTFDAVISDGTISTNTTVTFTDGVAAVVLKAGETITISGLPEKVGYTVTETVPTDYTVEKNNQTGTVDGSEVSFVNTWVDPNPTEYGNLIVEKDVKHSLGTNYTVPEDKTFTVQVSLGADAANQEYMAAYGTAGAYGEAFAVEADENGVITLTLKDGEQAIIYDIVAGTEVTVTETDVPSGFTVTYEPEQTVTIAADKNTEVVVVNTYEPEDVTVEIDISGTKIMSNWTDEVFTFYLQKYVYNEETSAWEWVTIATDTATADNPSIDFMEGDTLTFDAIGTYAYRVIEANHGKTIDGIVYDSTIHSFDVVVTDNDMDGQLEAVIESAHTTAGGFALVDGVWVNNSIDFTNQNNKGETSVTVMIQKYLKNASGSTGVSLAGYTFELYETGSDYDYTGKTPVLTSDVTDASGESFITLLYEYSNTDTTYHYYVLKEAASGIAGMTDSAAEYKFAVKVTCGDDGSVTAEIIPAEGTTFAELIGVGDVVYNLAKFTNVYEPDPAVVKIDISGTKTMSGDWTDEVFTFYLQKYENGTWRTIATDTATAADPAIDFMNGDTLTFDTVGTYSYRVIEEHHGETIDGIVYDATIHTFTVTVTDGGNGELVATVESSHAVGDGGFSLIDGVWTNSSINFTNVNNQGEATVTIMLGKLLDNASGSDKVSLAGYEFEVYETNEKYERISETPVYTSEKTDATGRTYITLDYEYDTAGTTVYYCQLAEKASGIAGMTDSAAVYNFYVTVTANEDGTITAVFSPAEDETKFGTLTGVGDVVYVFAQFTNTYKLEPVNVTINLNGLKTVTGGWVDGLEFKLALQEYVDGTWVTVKDADGNELIETVTSADAIINFVLSREYTEVGTYAFRVIEKNHGETIDGIVYDATIHSFTVTVTDDGKGHLAATVASSHTTEASGGFTLVNGEWTNDSINFTNINNKGEATVTIILQKLLENPSGSDQVSLAGYEFEVYKTDENYKRLSETPVYTSEKTDATGWSYITLDYINGTAGTAVYYYQLAEKATGIDGMKDSTAVYNFYVEVVSRNDGTVTAAIYAADGTVFGEYEYKNDGTSVVYKLAAFTNVYTPDNAVLTVPVTKNLTGRDMMEGEFEFDVYWLETQTDAVYVAAVKNAADGTVSVPLGEVEYDDDGNAVMKTFFDQVGTYYYKIAEKIPEGAVQNEDGTYTLNGVTYDNSVYYVRVTVSDNGGELTASYVVLNDPDNSLVFNNTYEAEPTEVNLSATKALNDLTLKPFKELEADMFSFTLVEVDENGIRVPGGVSITVSNDADGLIDFGTLEYTEAGTYWYLVSETAGKLGGIAYDSNVYLFKVVVTDNGKGALENTVTLYVSTDGGSTYTEVSGTVAAFTNTYTVEPVYLPISGTKTLTGRNQTAGEFEFVLVEVDADGNIVEGGVTLTAINNADGSFTFGTITYNDDGTFELETIKYEEEGTYYYLISEKTGSDENIIYDTSIYLLTVVVTDDGEGKLVATPTLTLSGEVMNRLSFTNVYETEAVLKGYKELLGRDMTAGEFEFIVSEYDIAGEAYVVVAKGTNDADGNIVFYGVDENGNITSEGIMYDAPGTHYYLVSEVNGDAAGITYDTTKFKVVVEVEVVDGELVPIVTYSNGTADGDIKFVNSYTPEPIKVVIEADKVLMGREQNAGEFSFEVRDSSGNLVATGTNAADGTIEFTEVTIAQAGTYTLTVTEVHTGTAYVYYDSTSWTVVVTATLDENGVLVPEVAYPDGDITFVNVYDEPEFPETPAEPAPDSGDHTMMALWSVLSALSGSTVVGLGGLRRRFRRRR